MEHPEFSQVLEVLHRHQYCHHMTAKCRFLYTLSHEPYVMLHIFKAVLGLSQLVGAYFYIDHVLHIRLSASFKKCLEV